MSRILFFSPRFVATIGSLLLLWSAAVAQDDSRTIDDEALYQLLADELTATLKSDELLTPLPLCISEVAASADHLPVFAFNKRQLAPSDTFDRTLAMAGREHDGFRLLSEGQVVGWGAEGEFVVSFRSKSEGAVVTGGAPRKVRLPQQARIERAFKVGQKWIYCTSAGIFSDEDMSAWPGSEVFIGQAPFIHSVRDFAAIRPAYSTPDRPGLQLLKVGVGPGESWSVMTYERFPFSRILGLLRRGDGSLIAISDRIVTLTQDLRASPTETELAAVLTAAEHADTAKLPGLLAAITTYPQQALTGLGKLLAELPAYGAPRRDLESILRTALAGLDQLQKGAVPTGQRQLVAELQPIMDHYREATRKALEETCRVGTTEFDLPRKQIGELVQRGYQYYDGWWIQSANVLAQEGLSEAMVQLGYYEVGTGERRWGVFVLNGEGRLKPVYLSEPGSAQRSYVYAVKDPKGGLFVFFQGYGLARIADGQLVWVDRGEAINKMDSLRGCDQGGRLYFSFGTGGQALYWVYHAGGRVPPRVVAPAYPVGGGATVDSQGRLWLVHDPQRPPGSPGGAAPGLEALEHAEQKQLKLDQALAQYLNAAKGAHSAYPKLVCLDTNGKLYQYFSCSDLQNARAIQAGEHGAVLVVCSETRYLVHDQQVIRAKNLHELAEQQFGLLVEVAPGRSPVRVQVAEHGPAPLPSWFTAGEVLWVADGQRVEAYREGKPLLIDKRLALLSARRETPMVLGPLGPAQQAKVLIVCRPDNLLENFWATQGAEGIGLERAGMPNRDLTGSESWNIHELRGYVLVDHAAGCVFGHFRNDRVWRLSGPNEYAMICDAGDPVLSLGNKRMVVYRGAGAFPGYRIVGDESWVDIPLTYVKPLRVIGLDQPDQLVCLTPDGLAWLKPTGDETYTLARSVRVEMPGIPQDYLGRSATSAFVMTAQGWIVAIPLSLGVK